MSRLLSVHDADDQAGVGLFPRAFQLLRRHGRPASGVFAAVALYVAAVGSAALVFASQLVNNWSDASLLWSLTVLWAIAFVVILAMSGVAGSLLKSVRAAGARFAARQRHRNEINALWALAQTDDRAGPDLAAAMRGAGAGNHLGAD